MNYYFGIDPGKSGGFAVVDGTGLLVQAQRMPIVSGGKGIHAYDVTRLSHHLARYSQTDGARFVRVCVERVGIQSADGRQAIASLHWCGGLVKGIAAAMGLPYHDVLPREWQKVMLKGYPTKTYQDRKLSAANVALGLFPDIPIKCKADWGMADAALIAEHVRREVETHNYTQAEIDEAHHVTRGYAVQLQPASTRESEGG